MKKEKKILFILLAVLLAVLSSTIVLAIKLDKSPDMQYSSDSGNTLPPRAMKSSEILNTAAELLNSNDLVQAEKLLTDAVKDHPANADMWLLLGTVYYRQEKYEPAENAFRHLLRRKPDNAAAYNNLCETLKKLKRYNEAKLAIGNALKLAPHQGEILLNAASLYALQHEDKQALHFLQRALDNGITPEKISDIKELVHLLERPDFMNYYQKHTRQKKE